MATSLNFRNFAQPTLPLTMNDAEGTPITVTAPTVELVELLQANQAEITAALSQGDESTISEIWTLAARLISCNREGRQVTAEDLKGRYGISYAMLLVFFKSYMAFINEIEHEKN